MEIIKIKITRMLIKLAIKTSVYGFTHEHLEKALESECNDQ